MRILRFLDQGWFAWTEVAAITLVGFWLDITHPVMFPIPTIVSVIWGFILTGFTSAMVQALIAVGEEYGR